MRRWAIANLDVAKEELLMFIERIRDLLAADMNHVVFERA